MNYFINEHSLREQFKDIEEFWESIRKYTLPALKKIESKNENIIWKKDTFWQAKVCNGMNLIEVLSYNGKKNERTAIILALKAKMRKLLNQEPYWHEIEGEKVEVCEYKFDKPYSESLPEVNCFTKAILYEGRLLSFLHENYKQEKLETIVCINGKKENEKAIILDNIYSKEWWNSEPVVKTWRLEEKYLVEVRSNEFAYHPPHFHVSCNEFEAVFKLSDGQVYKYGKESPPPKFFQTIKIWYKENYRLLSEAWKEFHSNN